MRRSPKRPRRRQRRPNRPRRPTRPRRNNPAVCRMTREIQRIMNKTLLTLLTVLSCALPLPAAPKPAALTDVQVFPADVNLKSKQDRQSIVVQAIYSDGIT